MPHIASDLETSTEDPDPASLRHGSDRWLRGFHGALVDVAGVPPMVLRELVMSRRSTGLGSIDPLVELPGGPAGLRSAPRGSVGDRPAAHIGHGTAHLPAEQAVPESPGAPATTRVLPVAPPSAGLPTPREPGEDAPDARHAATGAPRPPVAPADEEPLSAFVDRSLAEARYLLLPNRSRTYAAAKRLVDLVLAGLLLIALSPVFLALVVLIRLDSPGPAIFRQERVTLGGRIFRFYKFRTMYVNARERFPELYDYSLPRTEFENAYYKLVDDPRNTRVGAWLRRTTLDELPNLLNVIKGDLSLVGPRPDLPEFVRLYRPEELCCLFTKAGLTGVAQVAGRSLLTVRERLALDMRYVAHQTLLLDLRILWRTVVVVLSGRGAF